MKLDKFARSVKLVYFPSHDPKLPDKWNLLRGGHREMEGKLIVQ